MATAFDLVAMTVSSAFGSGSTIPLSAAATINGVTYLSFASAGAAGGTLTPYSILDSSASEVGIATYTSSNVTLTGRTPTKSTNSNSAIVATSAAIILGTVRAEDLPLLSQANVFTATQQAPVFQPTAKSTVSWGIDFSPTTTTVAASSFSALPTGAGLVILTDGTQSGNTGIYVLGGSAPNASVLVAQSGSGTHFVAPSTNPGSSTYSIAWDGANYDIFNGSSIAITFTVATIRTRPFT